MKREPDDSVATEQLRHFYSRWLALEDAKASIADDSKELFGEAKGFGYDTKALRESFRRVRSADDNSVKEHDALVDLYIAALARDARDAREGTQSTAEASVSEPRLGISMPGKDAGRTVPEASQADIREAVTGGHRRKAVKQIAEQPEADSFNRPPEPESRPALSVDTPSQLEETQRQGESEQRRDDGSQSIQSLHIEAAIPAIDADLDGAASLAGAEGEADRQPHSEPEVHSSWLKSTVVPIRKPVTEAPKQDRTKPHPDCLDPAECGLSSWDWFCSSCKKAAEAKRAGAA